jgi:hypothetical protein
MPRTSTSPNLVSTEFARLVAVLVHGEAVGAGLHGMAAVSQARVADAAVTVFDLDGEPLFYDYALRDEAEAVIGTIRTAAHRRLGSPLISISHAAPGWDPRKAVRMASEALHSKSPNATVVSSRLVCYAYPKIGVELSYRTGRRIATEVFDASSGSAVANSSAKANQFTRYSLLAELRPQAAARVKAFRAAETRISRIPISSVPLQLLSQTKQGLVLLSPYCLGSPVGLTHYAQITNFFCVDASAQMLLEHYGWNYTQNAIASAMGTTAAQGGTSGTGLTTGFASLTNTRLSLAFDDGASRAQQFADAVTEVDANRPLFTQVPHHYRVCVGYSEVVGLFFGNVSNQMLYIYDPWPWNPDLCMPGAPYWETWATSPVMWFGIVHHA